MSYSCHELGCRTVARVAVHSVSALRRLNSSVPIVQQRSLRVLFEIRLRWSDEVLQEARARDGGFWLADTPHNRRMLEEAVAQGNGLYGERTHWIEKRQA